MVLNPNDRSPAIMGALAVASVLVFTALFVYATNRSLTQKRADLWIVLVSAEGLQQGDRVLFRGVQVGEVKRLEFGADGNVLVRTRLTRPVPLTSAASARLVAADVFGRQSVVLEMGIGGRALVSGDTLSSGVAAVSLTDRIGGVVSSLERAVSDSTVVGVQALLGGATAAALAMEQTLGAARFSLDAQSEPLHRALQDGAVLTANLRAATDSIRLAELRESAYRTMLQLERIAAQMDTAAMAVSRSVRRVENGQGTIGLLAGDPELYQRSVAALESLELLLTDLRQHPKRYINVRIF